MKIKVCGITRNEDLTALQRLGVDFAGFIFYEGSKRFIGDNTHILSQRIIDSGLKRTGVFVNAPVEHVLSKAEQFKLDLIQLHGNESPAYCEQVRKKTPVVKAFNIDEEFSFPSLYDYRNACDNFLFDAKGKLPGGNSISFNWNLLEAYQLTIPFFLSGGITPQHITQILAFSHPSFYGIDVNSGFEISPGVKNIPLLETFIQKIRSTV